MRSTPLLFAGCAPIVVALALLFSLQACSPTRSETRSLPDAHPVPDNQCFPSAIEGFKTVNFPASYTTALRSERNSIVGGYNAEPFHTAVSVFVYDREPLSADEELANAKSEILRAHRGSQMAMSGAGEVPLAGTPTKAQGGLFLWSEGKTDFGSFLWLIPRRQHYVKIRGTYIRPPGDDATKAMQFAITSIRAVAQSVCSPE